VRLSTRRLLLASGNQRVEINENAAEQEHATNESKQQRGEGRFPQQAGEIPPRCDTRHSFISRDPDTSCEGSGRTLRSELDELQATPRPCVPVELGPNRIPKTGCRCRGLKPANRCLHFGRQQICLHLFTMPSARRKRWCNRLAVPSSMKSRAS
jgi:hypothetical protein